MSKQPIRKAILPVAGFGTRFLPATKAQPKEMLPLVDTPVIQYLVEEAVNSGIEQIIFVTGRSKRALEDHFDSHYELECLLEDKGKREALQEVQSLTNMAEFFYVRQKQPRGNGDAILSAKNLVGNEPCAVLFGDDLVNAEPPALQQLINVYEQYEDPVIALTSVPHQQVSKYGIVEGETDDNTLFKLRDFKEKPDPTETDSSQAVIGKYVITPDFFDKLEDMKGSIEGELGMDNAVNALLGERDLYGLEVEGTRYDCGDKLGYIQATIDYALKHETIGDGVKDYLKSLNLD